MGKAGRQPRGWGLAAWQKHGGRRNGASSWLYVHAGNYWLMDWKLVRVSPRGNCNYRTCPRFGRRTRRKKAVLQCRTTARGSNAAGVVKPTTARGYTMLGGGMVNHYRRWDAKAGFEEAFPQGNQF